MIGIPVVIHRLRVDGDAAAALLGLGAKTKPVEILVAGEHAIRHRGLEHRLQVDRRVRHVLVVRRREQDLATVRLGDSPLHAIGVREVLMRHIVEILRIARGVKVHLDLVSGGRSLPVPMSRT